jgi:hypothetical protein
MKRKLPAARNPYVAAAKFRKAGKHSKTVKAVRRAEKQKQQGALAEWSGICLLSRIRSGSNPTGSTKSTNKNDCTVLFVFYMQFLDGQSGNGPGC